MTTEQPMTELQREVAKRIAAEQAAETEYIDDLAKRIATAAANNKAAIAERNAVVEAARQAELAAAQQRRHDAYEQQLRLRARSGWQGDDASFEEVYPQLRQQLISADVLAADRAKPVVKL